MIVPPPDEDKIDWSRLPPPRKKSYWFSFLRLLFMGFWR
jgi:hypothetical protein